MITMAASDSKSGLSSKRSCLSLPRLGREVAIVGSSKLAELSVCDKRTPKAMLNLDMVGEWRRTPPWSSGATRPQKGKSFVAKECETRALDCPGGAMATDRATINGVLLKGCARSSFFYRPHLDYHRTRPRLRKINATGRSASR